MLDQVDELGLGSWPELSARLDRRTRRVRRKRTRLPRPVDSDLSA
jgi:hypothetical protein